MRTSYILMIVTIISKVFGLLREKTLAYFFGLSVVADAFLIAFQIPMAFTNVISGATANGFIPMYNQAIESKDREYADRFTASFTNLIFIITGIISIILVVFAKQLVVLMAPGFEGEKLSLSIFMTRMGLLSLSVTSMMSVFKAYLQIKRRFVVSVVHAIVQNILMMSFMYFAYKNGYNYLGIGILISFIFQYIIFFPYLKKEGYKHKIFIDFKDPHLKLMMSMILPIIVSTSVIELNFMISKALASDIESGVSILNYAYKIQGFVTGIVITSVITAVYPQMARNASLENYADLKKSTLMGLSTIMFLVIPATVGLFIFAGPIIEILFVGGKFTVEDAMKTRPVLALYAIGLIGIGFREIMSRVFYTLDDSKTPVINSVLMVAVNTILSLILVKSRGVEGLALATSVSFLLGGILLIFPLKKRVGSLIDKKILVNIFKIIISSTLMGISSALCFKFVAVKFGDKLRFLISLMVAGAVYFISTFVLKVDEIDEFIRKKENKK